ncbi:hypothetical protein MKW98_004981 [Papaver atlanticum]|uniref:Uncharacterized protein n=1 Tax=Papaver atlanticum TaxID=357466 RepID=A0AAD4TD00_9MAGN|nr:hypothetical protein MKW98_004981 [Papaver atlanticum]
MWINYALYEELDAEDMDRTREVYRECLKLIPHKKFSFGKIWLMAAQFEIRQKNLTAARKILDNAIGVAWLVPKDKKTVMLGSNLLNWRYLWVRLNGPEQFLILQQNNIIWICQNCYGRHTSISKFRQC